MRVVFMGTPSFAVPSLMALASRHEVTLVVTRPDRAAGRGTSLRHSAVKCAALDLGLPLLQPSTLRGDECERIAAAAPDVICVAAFGMILPPEVLGIPRYGCINVHASLLPTYRGAAPVQRAILAGDPVTGVSIMRMEQGLDTGAYAAQR
ncbi:methionyl-tRNA formyltransferase, partial [bacterium]|nr:methionyl-tRNA formyltransferase [bacterium]